MLSHRNMLWNIQAGLKMITVYPSDLFLSFLPMSHTLERTIGYYLPIVTSSTVAYARSIADLTEDLVQVAPTILISVPRVFERVRSKLLAKLDTESGAARSLFEKAVEQGDHRAGQRREGLARRGGDGHRGRSAV